MAKRYFADIRGTITRPYVVFRRMKNRGLSPRPEKVIKSGKHKGEKMPAFPGEQYEDWYCCLVDHKAPNAPHTWATKDWLISKISDTCYPIGYGNFEPFPAGYPSEWAGQLMGIYDAVKGLADTYKKRVEAEERLAAKEAEMAVREAELAERAARLAATSEDTGMTSESRAPRGRRAKQEAPQEEAFSHE